MHIVLNEFKMGHCSKKNISSSISNLHSLQIRSFNGIFWCLYFKIFLHFLLPCDLLTRQETIARQTIELTFEPFFIGQQISKLQKFLKIFKKFQNSKIKNKNKNLKFSCIYCRKLMKIIYLLN
jgi:hypothetical protein